MTTQIDGNRGTQVQRTEAGQAGERLAQPAPRVPADLVDASKDAELVNQAAPAENEAPAIRLDKVEQAKKALADGTLGTDSATLADAILDRMLDDQK
jgi:flagellar biosynthesis anti-sigma factor FlgM